MNRLTTAPLFAATALLTCCARPAEPPRSNDTFVAARADSFAKADRNLLDARQREVSDLVAQEGMNAATKRMADTADMQLVLGWMTLAGLLVTTIAAFGANRMARKALELSTIATVAELRPYLGDTDFDLVRHDDATAVEYLVKNFGPTVARDIKWGCRTLLIDGFADLVDIDRPEFFASTKDILPGDKQRFGYNISFDADDLAKVEDKSKTIVIRIDIEYRDMFGNSHVFIINDVRRGAELADYRFNRSTHGQSLPPSDDTAKFKSLWRKWRARAPARPA